MAKKTYWILISIVMLAFALRVFNIGAESIWEDEGYALRDSLQPTLGESIEVIRLQDGTPPLFFVLLRYWSALFGESEMALRMLSALFSTFAVLVLFFVGKEVMGENEGLIASFLMAVSTNHILYAQEIRPYGLFVFLVLSSIYTYISFLKNKQWGYGLAYSIFTALMLYTHHLGIIIVSLQIFLFVLLYDQFRVRIISYSKWLFLLFILYLPNIYFIIPQIKKINYSLYGSLKYKLGLPEVIARLGGFNFLLPIFVGMLATIFLLYLKRKKCFEVNPKVLLKSKFNSKYSIPLILLVIAASVLSANNLSSVFFTRYTHFLLFFGYLFAAYFFVRIKKSHLKNVLLVITLVCISTTVLIYHTSYPRKDPWREIADHIGDNHTDYPIVAYAGPANYTIGRYFPGEIIALHGHNQLSENQKMAHELAKKLQNYTAIWYVSTDSYRSSGLYDKVIEEEHRLVQCTKFENVKVKLYKKD